MPSPTEFPIVEWTLVLVQILTLIALIIYVWKTWEMARATLVAAQASAETLAEMRLSRRELSDPRPFIYFSVENPPLAEIILENTGQSTAADLSFTFEPPLKASQHTEDIRHFFDTPKHLPPGARLRYGFDIWPQYFAAKLPLQYSVILKYRRLDESEYREETQILDAAGFQHYTQWTRKGLHDIAEELHKLADTTDRMARDESSSRHEEIATAELVPTSMTFHESIAVLQALWKAHRAAAASGKVVGWLDPYLLTMRRAAVTALVHLETMPAPVEIKEAVQIVFITLHNHDWRAMGHQAATELDAALVALAEATQKTSDTGSEL
jgi:hypothetical protein